MADSVRSQLERASDDHFADASHVQHHDAESVSAAARNDVGFGLPVVSAHVGLWFLRLSASVEQARLFRHNGGYKHRAVGAIVRQLAVAGVARGPGCND